MSGAADISGLVASWVGVGIAVIGVLGIAPVLFLVESRSKTNRALRTVEDRGNGFIGAGAPWFNGNRLFRSVRAPDLSEPPKFEDDSKVGLKSATAQEVSSTGWVNLAALLLKFDTSLHLKRENCLTIDDLQTWLPVHRLWLLVLGLKGRYGIREDMGKAYLGQPETDYEYREESVGLASRKVLSGTTGVLEADLASAEDGFQKVYFGMHSPQVRGDFRFIRESRVRSDDQISLSTLFWLSFGFLPGKPGKLDQRIYHLGGYVSPARLLERARSLARPTESTSPQFSYEFKLKNLEGSQILWGEAIGVHKAPQVLHLVAREKDDIVREKWIEPGGTQASDWLSLGRKEHYISKPDVHRLILTLMTLELSPLGFMAPKNSQHFISLLFRGGSKVLFVLWEWAREMRIFDDKQTESDISEIIELSKTSKEPKRFSRRLAESLYDLHKMSQKLEPANPPTRLQNTVAILTITDKKFREQLKAKPNVARMLDAIRRARATWPPDETSLFGNLAEGERDGFSDEITLRDIVLPALRAATVCAWFTRSLDSTPLIKFVDCMGSVALVAAKAHAPYCPPAHNAIRDRSPPPVHSPVDTESNEEEEPPRPTYDTGISSSYERYRYEKARDGRPKIGKYSPVVEEREIYREEREDHMDYKDGKSKERTENIYMDDRNGWNGRNDRNDRNHGGDSDNSEYRLYRGDRNDRDDRDDRLYRGDRNDRFYRGDRNDRDDRDDRIYLKNTSIFPAPPTIESSERKGWDSSSRIEYTYVRGEDRGTKKFGRHEDTMHGDYYDEMEDLDRRYEGSRSRDRSRERKEEEDGENRKVRNAYPPAPDYNKFNDPPASYGNQETIPLGAMAGTRRPAANAREERQPKQVNFDNDRLPERYRYEPYRRPEPPREPRSEIDPNDRDRDRARPSIVESAKPVAGYDEEKGEPRIEGVELDVTSPAMGPSPPPEQERHSWFKSWFGRST